jgi:hypothetical protein
MGPWEPVTFALADLVQDCVSAVEHRQRLALAMAAILSGDHDFHQNEAIARGRPHGVWLGIALAAVAAIPPHSRNGSLGRLRRPSGGILAQ